MDFYRGIAYGLDEEPKFRKVDLFRQIQQGIERMAEERKLTPVFILDEMQMAKDLFNFKTDSTESRCPYPFRLTTSENLFEVESSPAAFAAIEAIASRSQGWPCVSLPKQVDFQ